MTVEFIDRDEPVNVPDCLLGTHGKRLQVPKEGFTAANDADDLRMRILVSSAAEHLLQDLRWSYLLSHEIRALYRTFDTSEQINSPVQRALRMEIASSLKYTRIRIPNCPELSAQVRKHLDRHKCEIVGREHLLDLHRTFTIPRLGCADETVEL